MAWHKYFKPFFCLLLTYIVTCTVLRIILIANPITTSGFSVAGYLKIFLLGALSDTFVFILAGTFLWLYLLFLSDGKYRKPFGYIILGMLIALLIYLIFFNNILKQYGSVLPEIGIAFVGIKTLLFALFWLAPKLRKPLRIAFYSLTAFLFTALILLNALSEYYFWNEFGIRYNFIAVDYLIYTNEVIGNIMESYPVVPLFSVLALLAAGISFWIVYRTRNYFDHLPSFLSKIKITIVYTAAILLSIWLLPKTDKLNDSGNIFEDELSADGLYKFYTAFVNNKLSYFKFYASIDQQDAFRILKKQLPGIEASGTLQEIKDSLPAIHKNIVLITVESLSEDFLRHFGNTQNLTPFLDSLADESMFFTNLYAVGNRTVRGLEAFTLCAPPSPGESIIKQTDNKNKFSTGYVFRQEGYQVKFMYGGYSYFDNMKDFYEGNGYGIVDRSNFSPDEISFANIWGVCDEDMAKKAIQTMNEEAQTGTPFFNHWMTVSNHRPFTYPEGKIDIPGNARSRDGGVKYTDYALRSFFKMAEQQPWFKNTVFIIAADHCASSSGKMALPLSKYRIPCMVYAPGFIRPQQVHTLMSQIDVMPTVMGLLHFSYTSKFIGQDIFDAAYSPRAFIATYQDLGFIKNDTLTVLSPVKEIKQYQLLPDPVEGLLPAFQYQYKQVLLHDRNRSHADEAISYYQSIAWMLEQHKYQDKN